MTEHPPELVQHIANYGHTHKGAKAIIDAAKGSPKLAHLLAQVGSYGNLTADQIAGMGEGIGSLGKRRSTGQTIFDTLAAPWRWLMSPLHDWLDMRISTQAALNKLRALGATDEITAKRLNQAATLEAFGVTDNTVEVMCNITARGRVTQDDLNRLHTERTAP